MQPLVPITLVDNSLKTFPPKTKRARAEEVTVVGKSRNRVQLQPLRKYRRKEPTEVQDIVLRDVGEEEEPLYLQPAETAAAFEVIRPPTSSALIGALTDLSRRSSRRRGTRATAKKAPKRSKRGTRRTSLKVTIVRDLKKKKQDLLKQVKDIDRDIKSFGPTRRKRAK